MTTEQIIILIKTVSHGRRRLKKQTQEARVENVLSHFVFPRSTMNFHADICDVFSKRTHGAGRIPVRPPLRL